MPAPIAIEKNVCKCFSDESRQSYVIFDVLEIDEAAVNANQLAAAAM